MSQQPIPVILCVDVEPDKPFNPRSNPMPWKGYQRAVEFFSGFRSELEASTSAPVHLAWFYRMDPQVAEIHGDPGWAWSNYPEQARTLIAADDEFGLHTHPFRWDDVRNAWIQDYGNQRWVEHSVRMAFDTFRRELNRPCVSFRFGDRWMNNQTFRLLETLGVKYDLTLEPGSKRVPSYHGNFPYTGFIPDQRSVPRTIYRPALSNYQRSDPSRREGPYVIPVSTAPIHLESGTVYRQPPVLKRLYYRLAAPERVRNWTQALNIAGEPGTFRGILVHNLRTLRSSYLVTVGRSHIFTSAEFTSNVRVNLRALSDCCSSLRDRPVVFTTPPELIACLERA
jgi:hypothetical protein